MVMISTTVLWGILVSLLTGSWSEALEPPHETAIRTYYQTHAREENGRCSAPYIDDFDRIQVVEDSAEEVVVETHYLYRDWGKDRQAWRIGVGRSACVASNSRRFVLTRSGAGLRVAEMSPPLRS